MRLTKIDLSNLVAIAHSNGNLGLLIDRGDEIELIEIPAPFAAYQGLQQVNFLAAETNALPNADVEQTELPSCQQPIAMLPVNSSMACAAGYYSEEEILQIEFNNGSVYQYSGVEPETWESLQSADSIGKFYNSEIKGRYECNFVDDEEDE